MLSVPKFEDELNIRDYKLVIGANIREQTTMII